MEHWKFYLRARLLEALGRREAAIVEYRAALHANPGFQRAANRLAYVLAALERYAEAEPYFAAVLRAEPGNAAAHFNLGYTFDKRGLYEQAIAAFREATRLNAEARPRLVRHGHVPGASRPARAGGRGARGGGAAAADESARLVPLGMAHHAPATRSGCKRVILHLMRFDPRMARRLIVETGTTDLAYLVKDLVV